MGVAQNEFGDEDFAHALSLRDRVYRPSVGGDGGRDGGGQPVLGRFHDVLGEFRVRFDKSGIERASAEIRCCRIS